MKRFVLSLMGVAAFAVALRADPPVVPPVIPAKVGKLMTFEVKVEKGKELGYQAAFPVGAVTLVRLYSDDPTVFVFMAQVQEAGQYGVVFWTVGEKKGVVCLIGDRGDVKPVPDDGEVKPKPDPKPKPEPDVLPVSPTKLVVVIIEESEDQVAERGRYFLDKKLSARMKEKGHKFRVVDKDAVDASGSPPADVKRFLDKAKGSSYPQYYLVDEAGNVRAEGNAPKDPAALLAEITKVGG